jgi:hypothetical protein
MTRTLSLSTGSIGLCLFLAGLPANAQTAQSQSSPAAPIAEVDVLSIGQTGGLGNAGRVAVNASAGNDNQEANAVAIAIGDIAVGAGQLHQSTMGAPKQRALQATAVIVGDAFAGSSGMIAVNAIAGSENQAANLAVFALGIEGPALADSMLSQTRSSQQPTGDPVQFAASSTLATVSDGAFAGSSGLVQVNLIGGERNSSANLFALTTIGNAKQ